MAVENGTIFILPKKANEQLLLFTEEKAENITDDTKFYARVIRDGIRLEFRDGKLIME